jgi:hypothetical protein
MPVENALEYELPFGLIVHACQEISCADLPPYS